MKGLAARIWAKDAALWKDDAAHRKLILNSLGWLGMPETMRGRADELEAFAADARGAGFTKALLLGMGGSSLAPEVFRRVFGAKAGFPELLVLDSTDPEAVAGADRACPPEHTLYIVASKSGTTTEPLRLFDYFWGRAQSALGAKAGAHFVAITDPGSFLEGQAKERGFRKVFQNFPDIGGRFSALSYFGLVPAALIGVDVRALLERAGKMAKDCALDGAGNPGLLLGLELGAHAKAGRDKLTLLLPREVESLGLWLEQLVAESTGKEGQGVVPVAGEPAGAWGEDRVFVVVKLKGEKDAEHERLAAKARKEGHPVLVLEMDDLLELGAEFFRWEFATAALGHALAIDPFDQPDVQSAKDRTKTVLEHRAKTGALPATEQHVADAGMKLTLSKAAAKAGGDTPEAALAGFLGLAKPGDYLCLLPFLSTLGEYDAAVAKLAEALRAGSMNALQTGYGPRYLHSTGQLHKGGPDKGLFLLILREGAQDAAIPNQPYGFADLVNAQAIGDFQALEGAKRRALLVRLVGDPKKGLERLTKAVKAARTAKA
ncbi:MAG: glucose-6-phosphate isomerase [Elusimicrobiota bacterium]|jgi:glucose-6-phosphate isomerase